MKAVVHTRYGPPEVASLQEVPQPHPQPQEVRLQVHASTVNRTDCGFRSAQYFVSRFWSGLWKPRYQTLGCEFAGVVDEVGSEVTTFRKGDRVFGYNDQHFGGHAEYLCIREDAALVQIPDGVSFEEAAAISEGAHYALCNIRAAQVKEGQRVMVYGATGAIGSAAVQLLKFFGAHVTAICNSKNVELLDSLKADMVIDYEQEDFTKTPYRYDLILDAVGKSSFQKCKPLLKSRGIYISTELGAYGANIFYALLTPIRGKKRVLFPIPDSSKEDLEFLKERIEAGDFRPVIDRSYPIEDIVEAYRYVETGQKTGNVVLKIGPNAP